MSIDRSLKLKSALVRHRNVLTRTERIEKLKKEEKWLEGDSLLSLPKVVHRKARAKKAEKAEAKTVGVEGAEVAATEASAKGTAADTKAKAAEPKARAPEAKPKSEGKK